MVDWLAAMSAESKSLVYIQKLWLVRKIQKESLLKACYRILFFLILIICFKRQMHLCILNSPSVQAWQETIASDGLMTR